MDGSQIIVEFECGRTLPGWVPRRLGRGYRFKYIIYEKVHCVIRWRFWREKGIWTAAIWRPRKTLQKTYVSGLLLLFMLCVSDVEI